MPAILHRSPFPDLRLVRSDLLSFIFSNSANIPADRPIFVDAVSGEAYTYTDVIRRTKALACGLRRLAVQPGDVVGVFSPNSIDYPIFCYAILGCGATVSPMNAALTVSELHHQLKTSGAKCLIAHHALLDTAQKAAEGTSIQHIIPDHSPEGSSAESGPKSAAYFMAECPALDLKSTPDDLLHERPAFICFSSGTTGAAKGVISTHANMTSNVQQWKELYYSQRRPSPTAVALLPFSHIYAITAFICNGPFRGTTTVVLSKFDLDVYLSSIQRYKPDELQLVPPIALMLWKDARTQKYDLSSVRLILSAAAPLSPALGEAVEKTFAKFWGTTVHCHQGWGLTETSPLATGVPPMRMDKRRTVGCIVPNMKLRLVDPETLQDIAHTDSGAKGEIWCNGPNVMKGYFRNEAATREAFHIDEADGSRWFRTGDIGSIDRDGFVIIHDRIKDMIKYKGLQVIPSELEGKLLQHPDVEDCAVTSIWDDAQATELPIAFIVTKMAGSSKAQGQVIEEIRKWFNARVAAHKKLRGGIRCVDAIPKNPSGKILRRKLRDVIAAKL